MQADIIIRPFREADRAAVVTLTVAAFPGVSIDHNVDELLGSVAGRDWRWRKGRDVERDIDSPGTELAIAEDSEHAATVGYVTMAFDRETRIGWIHNLAVRADLRGHGLGRRLIEHALSRFRAEGMTVARIETLEQNSIGRQLYPSLGFKEVARQIHYAMPLFPQSAIDPECSGSTGCF
jgi:ribosomal protein S18 acetylase RimI-like enzyme